jgi:selenocysteine-specific elongation factor
MLVMATAGHVDHGKSTLVRALTGVDPDRFTEERRRGLTIDLGFAELPGGGLAFVDVPGHVRFISNMLAGVGAVTAAMFVVDAREGWKPQSEEHLRILDLVGVTAGVVVLTKVEGIAVEPVRAAVAERLAGSCLGGAPMVATDALAGIGMDELRAELDRLATHDRPVPDGRARLWVDRSFTMAGAGTVVTGTLTGGRLRRGDEVEVGPHRGRIRRLQSFGVDHDDVAPGGRVAVNLVGVDHRAVERGLALVHPGRWHPTTTIDASITVLPDASRVSRRGALALHVGSGEHAVRLRVVAPIEPGTTGWARIDLPTPIPLAPGDRFVLRDLGRGTTVGGGEVLDVDPVLPLTRAAPDRSVDRVVAERGWVEPDVLERLTGEARPATVGRWVVVRARLAAERDELVARVGAAGEVGVDVATLDDRARALLPTTALLVTEGRVRCRPDRLAEHPALAALDSFSPPPPAFDPVELRQLVQRGLVVQQDGISFAATAVERAAGVVAGLLAASPEGFTVAEVRQALGTTRKYALPLLAVLDARGLTVRRGEVRVAR